MAVNNIPLAIGQRWKTRDGRELEIIGNDGHSTYPWDLSNGFCVTNQGTVWEFQEDDYDLITLTQDEHGFIPWNGGECPVNGSKHVEYKMRGYLSPDIATACSMYWEHKDITTDIIAYRTVQSEVKHTNVDVEEEQTEQVDQTKEQKEITKMKQKYTVIEVLTALDNLSGQYVEIDLEEQIEEYLAVRESDDYKLYLELKAKFEKE